MKRQMLICATLLVALLFSLVETTQAQRRRGNMRADEILSILKPGQWAKLEGVVQKDMRTVLCKEVEILTGDFLDDDWEVVGVVRKVDKEKQEFRVWGLPVKLDEDVEFDSPDENFQKFEDIKEGMLIELEGTYLKDGVFLALEVEDESAKQEEKPEMMEEIEVVGKVEGIDPKQRIITIVGLMFQLTDQTKGKSVIQ